MKKFILFILAFMMILAACNNNNEESSDTAQSSETQSSQESTEESTEESSEEEKSMIKYKEGNTLDKAILIYMGYNANYGYASNQKYPTFSKNDYKILIEKGVEEFILCPTGNYNFTIAGDSNSMIIKQEHIDAITLGDLGTTNSPDLPTIKGDYTNFLSSCADATWRSLDYLVDEYIKIANLIVSVDKNAKIYFTFPENSMHALNDVLIDAHIENLYNPIKEKIDPDIWDRNIAGFYNCNEAVVQWYTKFIKSNTLDFDNQVVKHMRAMSDVLHADGKAFCWIPYYRASSSYLYAERIGYIANQTDIFDYIVMQPSYFFDAKHLEWVAPVEKSCELQGVVDPSFNIYGGENLYGTKIGPEMEVDDNVSKEDYSARYDVYVENYKKYVGTCPMVFYAGDRTSVMKGSVLESIARMYKV